MQERRDPGPRFSTAAYLTRMPEAAGCHLPPFLHAMRRRRPETEYLWAAGGPDALRRLLGETDIFDADWYLRTYTDVRKAGADPLEHFLRFGLAEARSPGPGFDAGEYARQNPDYARLFPTPLEHYLRYGRPRGLPGIGPPPYRRWVEFHDTLTTADREALEADIVLKPPPHVRIVHILDDAAMRIFAELLSCWVGQIVAPGGWSVELVPGWGVDTSAWAALGTSLPAGLPVRLSQDGPPRALGSDGSGADMLLVCAGPLLLRAHAACVLWRTLQDEKAEAVYSDHDHLDGAERVRPCFKPQYSPEYLRRAAYVGPVVALRNSRAVRAALHAVLAGERSTGPETIASLLLALEPRRIARAPFVLYHVPLGAGGDPSENRGREIVPERRSGAPESPLQTSVSIVIAAGDRLDLLRACIDGIQNTTEYPASLRDIVVVDNSTTDPLASVYLEHLSHQSGISVVVSPGRFNSSLVNNQGAAAATGDVLVFLNNDILVRRADWLTLLVDFARDPSVGIVGAKLVDPDGIIRHGGGVLGFEGAAGQRLMGRPFDDPDLVDVTRELTSVAGGCCAVRRQLFDELGGFDPVLGAAFNDIALCAASAAAGYRNIYVADPILVRHESRNRGFDDAIAEADRTLREANYVTTRFPDSFRDDPSYNPNLSLSRVMDAPAFPPRVVRPWRAGRGGFRVLLLSCVHLRGYGVPAVIAIQAKALQGCGFHALVGGPLRSGDLDYPGAERIALENETQAAEYAVSEGVDAVVSHTMPFHKVAGLVGRRPLCYCWDHGEPDPALFPDRERHEADVRAKRLVAPLFRRYVAISQAIWGEQRRLDSIVLRNGNSHLATWSEHWATARPGLRSRLGLSDRFVILNVCRFHADERNYKGLDRYSAVAAEFATLFPALTSQCSFLVAGRGDDDDVAFLKDQGLEVHPNVTDERLCDLYAAADLYMSFSRWEGYNLGIGQALAMGLPVIASDIPAHREFPIAVTNSVLEACQWLAEAVDRAGSGKRKASIESWDRPMSALCTMLTEDLAAPDFPGIRSQRS